MMATEHAPQSPSAQPSFAPVNPRLRRYSRSVVLGEQFSTQAERPFKVNSSVPAIRCHWHRNRKSSDGKNSIKGMASCFKQNASQSEKAGRQEFRPAREILGFATYAFQIISATVRPAGMNGNTCSV